MADDGHIDNMTRDVGEQNLKDDKSNVPEDEMNEEADDLNDDPDDISPEEFEALNSQMDQLNSALDVLEEQNDLIHAKLVDLLESNRAARKQFKEELEKKANEDTGRN